MSELTYVEALRAFATDIAGAPARTFIIMPERRIERIREFFGPGVEFVPQRKKETHAAD